MRNNTIHKLSAMAGLAALLLAGCQKDNTLLRIRLDHFAGDGKVYMDNITPRFMNGDAVCVNDKIDNAPTVSMTAGSSVGTMVVETDPDGYRAVYPDEYVTAVSGNTFSLDIPRVQEYSTVSVGGTTKQQVKAPMGGVNEGTELEFHNLGAMLAVVLVNDFGPETGRGAVLIDSIQVTASNASLWGPAEVSDITSDERSFTCTETGEQYKTVSLANANGTSLGITLAYNQSCTLYVSVPMVSDELDNRYTVTTYSHDDLFNSRHTRTQQNPYSGCIQLNRLAFVTFPFSLSDHSEISASIDGLYSVGLMYDTVYSTDGKTGYIYISDTIKVDFARKGNLQALIDNDGTVIRWQFANHQWDLLEKLKPGSDTVDANMGIGRDSGWVDLFGYSVGTSNNYGIYTSNTASDYTGTFVDWGTIPGVITAEGRDDYFTLSAAEWGFLLSYGSPCRKDASQKVFGITDDGQYAYVNGVPGVIFLPDIWTWTGWLASLEFPGKTTDKDGNITYKGTKNYSIAEWELLETEGAIFLPTGCLRAYNNNTWQYVLVAEGGLYATSTPNAPAHPIHNHNHEGYGYQYGLSVRLACDLVYKTIPVADRVLLKTFTLKN